MRGYGRAVQRVLIAVLVANLAMVALKLYLGYRSNSLAVLGDAVHGAVDASNNIVGLILVHYATRPPDDDHPYGHGKYETVAAFVLAGLLFLTAWELLRAAWGRILAPTNEVMADDLTLILLLASFFVNLAVTSYETWRAKQLGSDMLYADAAHTRADLFVTSGVFIGLLFARAGFPLVDPVVTFLVAGVIAWSGFSLFRATVPVLTDRIIYDPNEVRRLVMEVPGVESVHDIRSRGRPNEAYVQMHLVVDTRDVHEAHAITERVERKLQDTLGVRETLVHVEPDEHAA